MCVHLSRRLLFLSYHIEAVLLEGSAEDRGVGLCTLEGRVIWGLHLDGGSCFGCPGDPLKEAKLHYTDVFLLAQDTNTSKKEARAQGQNMDTDMAGMLISAWDGDKMDVFSFWKYTFLIQMTILVLIYSTQSDFLNIAWQSISELYCERFIMDQTRPTDFIKLAHYLLVSTLMTFMPSMVP